MKQLREDVFKAAKLKAWEANPRRISKDNYGRLKEKIKANGLVERLKVTEDGTVCDGNMRLKAIQDLGIDEVPVTVFDAPKDADKLEISLNSNENDGEWDEQKLMELAAKSDLNLEQYGVTLVPGQPLNLVMSNYAPDGQDVDIRKMDHNLDTFLEGNIKQIVLYFDNKQYEDVIPRMEAIREHLKVESNTEVFLALLSHFEKTGMKP